MLALPCHIGCVCLQRTAEGLHADGIEQHEVQVLSPLKDGLYNDFDLIEGLWDHALR